jgi:hypothetical protein
MKKNKEQFVGKLKRFHMLSAMMMLMMIVPFVSCGSDEPENSGNDAPEASLVTASELVGEWTLVRDNVLYSSVDSSKDDEVISYSGQSYPRYRFYKVMVSDDDVITMTEVSASGSSMGTPMQFTLEGNNLKTMDGDTAGTITHYDPAHAYDNLRIEWNKDYSPISFNAPVISTYMID